MDGRDKRDIPAQPPFTVVVTDMSGEMEQALIYGRQDFIDRRNAQFNSPHSFQKEVNRMNEASRADRKRERRRNQLLLLT